MQRGSEIHKIRKELTEKNIRKGGRKDKEYNTYIHIHIYE